MKWKIKAKKTCRSPAGPVFSVMGSAHLAVFRHDAVFVGKERDPDAG